MPDETKGPRLALPRGGTRALWRAAAPLSLPERTHLLLRYRSAPWAAVLEVLEPEGRILDVGCGPGLLAHLLEAAGFAGEYLGLDPDERKLARARRWLTESPARRFAASAVEEVPAAAFSQVALVDVLYLVPSSGRELFLSAIARALAPGGLLVALTSGGGPGWKRMLDRLQERLAVALGVTRGEVVATCDGAEIASRARGAGLARASVRDVGRGFIHGFELIAARRPPA